MSMMANIYEVAFDGTDAHAETIERTTGLSFLGDSTTPYDKEQPCFMSGKMTTRRVILAKTDTDYISRPSRSSSESLIIRFICLFILRLPLIPSSSSLSGSIVQLILAQRLFLYPRTTSDSFYSIRP